MKLSEILSSRWMHFDSDILGMDETDGCAIDCLRVIRAADDLIRLMPDCDSCEIVGVIQAATHQVDVLYFG
jgi:hypothetical protein